MHISESDLDRKQIEVISFDCYGTLIDWETGLLHVLRSWLRKKGIKVTDETILELYARFEALEEEGPFKKYRRVLQQVMKRFADHFGVPLAEGEENLIVSSLPSWQPFEDVTRTLPYLKQYFKLVVLSNVDNDLFAETARHFPVAFDGVITAENVRAYKPSKQFFQTFLDLFKLKPQAVIHVAQSLYHDIEPARAIGIKTVWLRRTERRMGLGATPDARTRADWVMPSMDAFVTWLGITHER